VSAERGLRATPRSVSVGGQKVCFLCYVWPKVTEMCRMAAGAVH
jgi:hypothetical protein